MKSDFQNALEASRRVSNWNLSIPVGTLVRYFPVITQEAGMRQTITTSKAWVVSNQPVVKVEGQSGGVSLDAIEIINPLFK